MTITQTGYKEGSTDYAYARSLGCSMGPHASTGFISLLCSLFCLTRGEPAFTYSKKPPLRHRLEAALTEFSPLVSDCSFIVAPALLDAHGTLFTFSPASQTPFGPYIQTVVWSADFVTCSLWCSVALKSTVTFSVFYSTHTFFGYLQSGCCPFLDPVLSSFAII